MSEVKPATHEERQQIRKWIDLCDPSLNCELCARMQEVLDGE